MTTPLTDREREILRRLLHPEQPKDGFELDGDFEALTRELYAEAAKRKREPERP